MTETSYEKKACENACKFFSQMIPKLLAHGYPSRVTNKNLWDTLSPYWGCYIPEWVTLTEAAKIATELHDYEPAYTHRRHDSPRVIFANYALMLYLLAMQKHFFELLNRGRIALHETKMGPNTPEVVQEAITKCLQTVMTQYQQEIL